MYILRNTDITKNVFVYSRVQESSNITNSFKFYITHMVEQFTRMWRSYYSVTDTLNYFEVSIQIAQPNKVSNKSRPQKHHWPINHSTINKIIIFFNTVPSHHFT